MASETHEQDRQISSDLINSFFHSIKLLQSDFRGD